MSAELRQESRRKLQSDAVNRCIKLKETKLQTYKNICVGLTLVIVVMAFAWAMQS